MSEHRVSRRQLTHLKEHLSERDLAILNSVREHRFLTTRQIARLHFNRKTTEIAALRSTNRTLAKLAVLGLLTALERRIGGVRAGSGAFVWSIGHLGARLLNLTDHDNSGQGRQREIEPSTTFLEHTLAVAEVHLRLREATRGGDATLVGVELEPACWRPYVAPGGSTSRLKPDLAAVTATGDFEDHWFFEIDLATEPPSRVVRKCLQYQEYLRAGTEQQRLGLFPAVVWIVPTSARQQTLRTRLAEEPSIGARLFTVITLDRLAELIAKGAHETNNINERVGKKGETS